mgnify:CR=1 FL=1
MTIDLGKLHGEEDFLRLLVRLGREAERRIGDKTDAKPTTWANLAERFFDESLRPVPCASRGDYLRWIRYLSEWADRHDIVRPDKMTRSSAIEAIAELFPRKASRERIQRFYRRVWKTLGWDETIWRLVPSAEPRPREFYRRLDRREIKRLIRDLKARNRELHDMVIIGYYTGLRLSDVAELERAEIDLRRQALRIVPSKVRTRKPHALAIPLIREAWEIVSARLSGRTYIFSERGRMRPSRRITKAFRRCKIRKKGCGRASFHSLRATFISLMDEAGVQPYLTDAITGHAAGGMHARYTQPSLETLRAAILKAIPPIG